MKTFARFQSVSYVLCQVANALEVSKYDSKSMERFKNNTDISLVDYKDMRDTLIESIVSVLCAPTLREPKLMQRVLHNVLAYYQSYVSHIETLGASQKQLDFVTLSHFWFPFVARLFQYIMQSDKELLIMITDRITPDLTGGGG